MHRNISVQGNGLNGFMFDFFVVDYNVIAISGIINIHLFNEQTWYKIMFRLIKRCWLDY